MNRIKHGILEHNVIGREKKENQVIFFAGKKSAKKAILVNTAFIHDIFRSLHTLNPLIQSGSSLPDIRYCPGSDTGIQSRKDLENLEIWPVVKLNGAGKKTGQKHKKRLKQKVSLKEMKDGLEFHNGEYTTLMKEPEIVALIEGADFIYPAPYFISDMSRSKIELIPPGWFRGVKDFPGLWKGWDCIACGAKQGEVRHIIGTSRIVRCPGCGLEYDNPQAVIPPEFLDKYSSRFDGSRKGAASLLRAGEDARVFMADLDSFFPELSGRPILDIGCASGEFLHVLNSGFSWPLNHLHGVDASSISAGDAREKHNLEIDHCPAESMRIPAGKYSLATIINTIEHLPDPGKVFRNIREALQPGGKLFIGTVPNVDSLPSRLFPEGFIAKHFPDGQHHYQFSPDTLIRLCEKEGFTVERLLGRRRDIVCGNIHGVARWLAYSCGVPLDLLKREDEMLSEVRNRLLQTGSQSHACPGSRAISIQPEDFTDSSRFVRFWQREIWSSPYASDTFDLWLRRQD